MKRSAALVAEVAPDTVTVTSTVPAEPAGEVALHWVTVEHVTAVAAEAPKNADPAPTTKPVPVMVTTVPPTSGPAPGLTPEMVGR